MRAGDERRDKADRVCSTLGEFVGTHVIHVRLAAFHEALQRTASFDDIITLHDKQYVAWTGLHDAVG
jgi:hypothetical protein